MAPRTPSQLAYYQRNKERFQSRRAEAARKLRNDSAAYEEAKAKWRKDYYRKKRDGKPFKPSAEYRRQYDDDTRTRRRALLRIKNRDARKKVLDHYGGRCACCKEDRYEFLAIDHINGGGNRHRKTLGRHASKFAQWIIKNNYPPGYRVLCHNCNQSIGLYGYCPHQGPPLPINIPDSPRARKRIPIHRWEPLGRATGARNGAYTCTDRVLRGEKNGHSKLTEESVRDIRRLYDDGESTWSLSQRYKVTRTTIQRIIARRIWRHVD